MAEYSWSESKLLVKCPYYISHSYPRTGYTVVISCEAPCPLPDDMAIQIKFRYTKERDQYMTDFCQSCYYRCPLFKFITKENEKNETRKEERTASKPQKRK